MQLRKYSSASFSLHLVVSCVISSQVDAVLSATSLPWSSKPFIVISRGVSSPQPFYPHVKSYSSRSRNPLVAIMSYYDDINASKPKSSILLNMTKHGGVFSIIK